MLPPDALNAKLDECNADSEKLQQEVHSEDFWMRNHSGEFDKKLDLLKGGLAAMKDTHASLRATVQNETAKLSEELHLLEDKLRKLQNESTPIRVRRSKASQKFHDILAKLVACDCKASALFIQTQKPSAYDLLIDEVLKCGNEREKLSELLEVVQRKAREDVLNDIARLDVLRRDLGQHQWDAERRLESAKRQRGYLEEQVRISRNMVEMEERSNAGAEDAIKVNEKKLADLVVYLDKCKCATEGYS